MSFIPESTVRALCWTLLHSLWQGLILAVVAGGVMLMTRRAPSATRYSILGVLVLGFLAVSGYTFFRELRTPVAAGQSASAGPSASAVPSAAVIHLSPAAGVDGAPAVGMQGGSAKDVPGQGVSGRGGSAQARISAVEQLVQYFNAHASVVVVIWFIVFLARFVKILSGLVYAQRVRSYQTGPVPAEWQDRLGVLVQRLKISRPVRLLESALIKVPVTVGWLKPVILVPMGMLAQLPADQVESILLHELAHIGRRDYLFNLVQNLVDTLFFFNPALLWVSSLIRTERENCCDDVAIRETRSRRRLIEALVSFHEYQQVMRGWDQQAGRGYVLGFAGKRDGMVKRVERIVYRRNHSLNPGERLLLMVGVLVLCGAFISVNREQKGAEMVVGMAPKSGVLSGKTMVLSGKTAVLSVKTVDLDPKTMNLDAKNRTKAGIVRAHLAVPVDTTKPHETKPDSMTKADIDLLIRARDHGVTPEYVAELKQLGYQVSLEQAIRLVDHGVSADFIRGIQKEGYSQITLDRAVELIDHGVTAEFIHQVKAEGFPNLTLNEAVRLVDHGVNVGFIRDWKKKAGSQLELNDYIKLRDAGIDPD